MHENDFFRKESMRALNDFNRIFGEQVIFNIRLRHRMLLMIIGLGLLQKKIEKEPLKSDIDKFMRKLAVLKRLFNQCSNERRDYDDQSSRMPSDLGSKNNYKYQDRPVPAVRQHLHHHMASAE